MTPSTSTVASIGLGVPLAVLVSWGLSLAGITMPVEAQTALGAVLSAIVGYFFVGGQSSDTV